MTSYSYKELVDAFIKTYGEDELAEYLINRLSPGDDTLTIIGNAGLHTIPKQYLHGDIYEVSAGNLNLATKESTLNEYRRVLIPLAEKLQEKSWKKVYLIPTGHTTLVLQIKLLVYHILRISTIDLFYSKGSYFELEIDYRHMLEECP